MKKQKNLWKIILALVGGALVIALVVFATTGEFFQGKSFKLRGPTVNDVSKKTTTPQVKEQTRTLPTPTKDVLYAFNVKLISSPNAIYESSDVSVLDAKLDSWIDFTRVVDNQGGYDFTWKWTWDAKYLECSPDPVLRCYVLAAGESSVSYTAYPKYPNGTIPIITSNFITVRVPQSVSTTSEESIILSEPLIEPDEEPVPVLVDEDEEPVPVPGSEDEGPMKISVPSE